MNLLLKCVVEYLGAIIIALSVFYESSPLFAGFLYGMIHLVTNKISGGFLSAGNVLFVGPIKGVDWQTILALATSNILGCASVYLAWSTGVLGRSVVE